MTFYMIIFHHSFRESSSKLVQYRNVKNKSSFNPKNLYIQCFRSNKLQCSTKYQGVIVLNLISRKIQNLSKLAFKHIQSYS